MKKYALILIFLMLIGIGLSIQFLTQDERLDQTVFQQTTESIRNLQALDKSLLLLLNESRFDTDFDHAQIYELDYQISEEFDNLRYEALFEEIEKSPDLSIAVDVFKTQFESREELLEDYEQGNVAIAKSLMQISNLGARLQTTAEIASQTELAKLFVFNQTQLFSLALGRRVELDLSVITANSDFIASVKTQMSDYNLAIETIAENYPKTLKAYENLNALATSDLLDTIEQHYVSYHNQAIGGSNNLRNALITYGVLLLTALMFFGLQIRRNVVSLEQQIADRTAEIKSAYDELQESQEQLIQSEKMASLGQMVAGVAHEINTQLGYVTSNVDTLKLNLADINIVMQKVSLLMTSVQKPNRDNREITANLMQTLKSYRALESSELLDESRQLLDDGAYGLSEISKLVVSLKDFARLDRQNAEKIDLHGCIESSLTIASNHIRENNVRVVRTFSELPLIDCFPSKLNQLFLNIITNACQAMTELGGELSIKTTNVNGGIRIDFSDQGIGMDQQTKQKMFDPFFTSKDIGVGTGLGLSIAYKIVEAHNGSLEVDSSVGQGTTLSVILPTNKQH
ncbi:MAG: signal transduction histidine kinase [Arenicella sp.]|jgi:signal transduction histidine kinase